MEIPSVLLLLSMPMWILEAEAYRLKHVLPIQPEQDPVPSKVQTGCLFGGKYYSMVDTWHPDLGEPFGVMHCVICYCEPRGRRGKASGKVTCRNFKHDCPPPLCSDAIMLPGHCCKTCPKKKEYDHGDYEYFDEKDDDQSKDRYYLNSDDVSAENSRTEYVALLTAPANVWPPVNTGVAKARFYLQRTNLLFTITYKRIERLSRVRFSDAGGSVLYEHPIHRKESLQSDTICGVWRNVPRSSLRLLNIGHIVVSLMTTSFSEPEIFGKIIRFKAPFAESFSTLLTPNAPDRTIGGGLAMLTLSDADDNLHFILMLKGLQRENQERIPILMQITHQDHVIREIRANVTGEDLEFAEVLPHLSNQEMMWLAHGQLSIAILPKGNAEECLSGVVTVRKSCNTLQSVLSGGDAMIPTKTGAVGSGTVTLHENGTMEYQIQVAGVMSAVTSVTLETKPRRRARRHILHDLTNEYYNGKVWGLWKDTTARDLHMLLQNELFFNVATEDYKEGELRGQITSLLYRGPWARYEELPVPLAGQFLSPPRRTGSAGHAWVSLDEHCHLHYQIVVTGLGRAEDATLNAHLHGIAELGEVSESSQEHKRLLKGFYGSEAQGSVKDLELGLFAHLNQGTAFLQVSTKLNPNGEIRGSVHIPNNCKTGGVLLTGDETEYDYEVYEEGRQRVHEDLRKDPRACYFEGQVRAHGSRWAPDYDRKCSVCSCQKRTVICDPIVCQPLNCTDPIQLPLQCCPVCEEKKENTEVKKIERPRGSNEGCFSIGDRSWKAAGTDWNPVIPPFGLMKCAVCTCKGSTEVQCKRVTCPPVTCSNPVRNSTSDCCKQCPAEEKRPVEMRDRMQADSPRSCRFGGHWYQNNESWYPTIASNIEMKCIICTCLDGVIQCQRKECTAASCSNPETSDAKCCPGCKAASQEEEQVASEDPRSGWAN
uniref:Chordin n=1 Tax=Leptobrachium leishanense TaxID=445787 RepID=A0A8C5PHH7_9ANUR